MEIGKVERFLILDIWNLEIEFLEFDFLISYR